MTGARCHGHLSISDTNLFPPLGPDPPDRKALSFPDQELSYRELRAVASSVADQLGGLSRVAVLAEPRIETAVAVIGALAAGVPLVPVNPKSGGGELAHIVDDAEPEALLVAPGTEAPDAFAGRRIVEIDLKAGDAGTDTAAAGGEPDAPALIVYTSGTTGPPKGAVLSRRAIASNLDALADAWAWTTVTWSSTGSRCFMFMAS